MIKFVTLALRNMPIPKTSSSPALSARKRFVFLLDSESFWPKLKLKALLSTKYTAPNTLTRPGSTTASNTMRYYACIARLMPTQTTKIK